MFLPSLLRVLQETLCQCMPRVTPVSVVPVKHIPPHVSLQPDPPKMDDKQEALLADSAPPSVAMTDEDKLSFQKWKSDQEAAQEAAQQAFEEDRAEREAQRKGMEGIEEVAEELDEKKKGSNTYEVASQKDAAPNPYTGLKSASEVEEPPKKSQRSGSEESQRGERPRHDDVVKNEEAAIRAWQSQQTGL